MKKTRFTGADANCDTAFFNPNDNQVQRAAAARGAGGLRGMARRDGGGDGAVRAGDAGGAESCAAAGGADLCRYTEQRVVGDGARPSTLRTVLSHARIYRQHFTASTAGVRVRVGRSKACLLERRAETRPNQTLTDYLL